ncbi:MAG: hypothetical protein JSS35_03120 [Proteobacteria bacterium]|nr:hypothetical protein [Pseudomonadota bacterium]
MHLRRSALLAALACTALAACGRSPNATDNPPAPPDVAANFAQPIDAKAADGSWSLKVRDSQLTLSRYGQPDLTVSAPGAMIEPHQATWIASMPDNQKMTVKIYASPCTDPATTETHAFSAEVDLPDTAPLSGCGDAVAGAPRAAPTATATPAKK